MMPDAVEIFNQGVTHFQQNELELALEAFTKAIEFDPGLAVAHNGRAVVFALLGDLGRAVADSGEAIRLDPRVPDFYRTRGLIYQEIGDESNAELDLEKARQLGYRRPGHAIGGKEGE
jgi:Flp pilus assembly protein TadD